MKTAEELLKEKTKEYNELGKITYKERQNLVLEIMIEFAKIHSEIAFEDGLNCQVSGATGKEYVENQSILNAYPLDQIK